MLKDFIGKYVWVKRKGSIECAIGGMLYKRTENQFLLQFETCQKVRRILVSDDTHFVSSTFAAEEVDYVGTHCRLYSSNRPAHKRRTFIPQGA